MHMRGEYGCGSGRHERECSCGCGHHERRAFGRHFFTKAEKMERMKHYAEALRSELKAVEEHIKELEAKKK